MTRLSTYFLPTLREDPAEAESVSHRLMIRAGLVQVHLVALGKGGDETAEAADRLYEELGEAGVETVYDDRAAGAGEKLTDAELLGCPLRIVVGKRTLAEGQVEAQERATGRDERLAVADAARRAAEIIGGEA